MNTYQQIINLEKLLMEDFKSPNNNSTYKSRYELARVEKFTENGISGKIELNSAMISLSN